MRITMINKALFGHVKAIFLVVFSASISLVIILNAGDTSGATPTAVATELDLSLQVFASGLSDPVGITNAGLNDDRLFIIEKAGKIKIVQPNGDVLPTPFLDIVDRVDSSSSEEGLLGLVFHPDYASSGYFYVNYTNTTSGVRRTRISRFKVTNNSNIADPSSENILLTVNQHESNHNAGDLHFGPDDYLYIPLGDGGGAGDTGNNAQELDLLLGKIVRIDVDANPGVEPDCKGMGSGDYTVPTTNPFVDGIGGTCDEIWAVGLRNPWQSSFDRLTDDFYIGDVGQNSYEEINFQPASSTGGDNYGWRCYEGNHAFNLNGCRPANDYTFPIFEYSNPSDGCSVVGGYVYRGTQYPFMFGHYLLTDYCSGNFWDLIRDGSTWQASKHTNLATFGNVAFGEDASGELYVVNRSANNVFHLVENTLGPILSIDKTGPLTVNAGNKVTYTITVANSGNLTATSLIITDTIPIGANYVDGSGGSKVGPVVRWTVDSLAPYGAVTQMTFAVTTTQTIVNNDYWVSADNGAYAVGGNPVWTFTVENMVYLPILRRE